MKLISCDNCGLVYDQDSKIFQIAEDHMFNDEEGSYDDEYCGWRGDGPHPKIICSCGHDVIKED